MPLDNHGLLMALRMGQISQPHRQMWNPYPCKGDSFWFREGSDDYFYIPDDLAFSWDYDFTIGFWFKIQSWTPVDDDDTRYLVASSPIDAPGWGLYLRNYYGTISLSMRMWTDAPSLLTSTIYNNLMLGVRYCVLVSFKEDGSDVIVKEFLGTGSGVILSNQSLTFSDVALAGETEELDLWLGRQDDLVTSTVPALMDEVHIWTSDVYDAIRVAWFNSGSGTQSESLGVPEQGTHCWWWTPHDFTGNLHTEVAGPTAMWIWENLIYQPGCSFDGEE